ncbi:MAG: EamA family transporter [Gammaproteobacteria bacterium]
MKDNALPFRVWCAIGFTVFVWSSAFIGIRIGLQGYDPGSLALLRFLIASVGALFLYVFLSKRNKPALRDIVPIFSLGAIGIGLYNIGLNYGEVTIHAGTASFILSQIPVVVGLLAAWFLKEKMGIKHWIGLGVSIIGVGLISLSHDEGLNFNLGILYLLLAVLCGGIYAILTKKLTYKYPPIVLTAFAMWSGTIILLPYLPRLIHEMQQASPASTGAAVYLGFVPAVLGYLGWSYVLRFISASRASSFLYLMPVVATILGWWILGEVPKLLALIGGVVALMGAVIVNQKKPINERVLEKSA